MPNESLFCSLKAQDGVNRRVFIEGTALFLTSTLLPSCGGSGSSTSTSTLTPPATGLTLSSVSTSTPMALTPVTVNLGGFDASAPFTVSLSDPSGNQIAQVPISVQNGAIVIVAPLQISAATGNTSAWETTLTVSQNGVTVSSPLSISDIPQLSDYGVSLGAITRAFYIFQEITLGASINAQQAIAALPRSTVSNSALLGNLQAQLNNVIFARNDIDRIITDNTLQIPVGTAPDGTSISFGANSVGMMDRVIGQYLLTY
jgi:hypothetical protein